MLEVVRTVAAFSFLVGLCWWITGDGRATVLERAAEVIAFLWKQVTQ